MTEESRFRSNATIVGKVTNTSYEKKVSNRTGKEYGRGNISVDAGGDRARIDLFDNNGSLENFLDGLKNGEVIEGQGTLEISEWDGNKYVNIQPFSANGVNRTTDTNEKIVVALEGDIYKLNIEPNEQGEMVGSLQLLVFDTYGGRDDAGNTKYLTRAEVLQKEIRNRITYLENNTDKDTSRYKELGKKLDIENDVATVHEVYTELLEQAQMRFWNINHYTLVFDGKLGERLLNEGVEKLDNVLLGARVVNRVVRDEIGIIEGNTTECKLIKFYKINEKGNAGEDVVDENAAW